MRKEDPLIPPVSLNLLEQARHAVSRYCYRCPSSCCKRGFLLLPQGHVLLAPPLAATRWVASHGGDLLTLAPKCPALKNNRCTQYATRPEACRNYPFFVFGKNLIVAPCPPIEQGLLHHELDLLVRAGYTLV